MKAKPPEKLKPIEPKKMEPAPWFKKLKQQMIITRDEKEIEIRFEDLEECFFLGSGQFGTVKKMRHIPTNLTFAVKMISDNVTEYNNNLIDLDVHIKLGNDCPFLIKFYGALHVNSYIWILTELMDISLDVFLQQTIELSLNIPEVFISKLAKAILNGLEFMDSKGIMHRDIKPSNILLNLNGEIKLCDFGISGFTKNSCCSSYRGCEIYMSPEKFQKSDYTNKSDIWSLGISLMEIATGRHPFKDASILGLMHQLETNPSPKLDSNQFSKQFCIFINKSLLKNPLDRYSVNQLLCDDFIIKYLDESIDLVFISNVIGKIPLKYV